MYLKLMGCIFIVLSGAGYGYSKGLEYKRHAEEVEYLSRLIREMQGETSYTKAPLAEVCRRAGRHAREPYVSWLEEMADMMEVRNDTSLAKLWKDQTENHLKNTALTAEERKELSELGGRMGYLDIRMQEEIFGAYAGRLEERQKKLSEEVAEKRKLCGCLGVMAGMFIAILLV